MSDLAAYLELDLLLHAIQGRQTQARKDDGLLGRPLELAEQVAHEWLLALHDDQLVVLGQLRSRLRHKLLKKEKKEQTQSEKSEMSYGETVRENVVHPRRYRSPSSPQNQWTP